jgi:hypothetical protein
VDDLGVVGRIPQHDHLGFLGERQFAYQIGRGFGRGAMHQTFLAAVLARPIRTHVRNPEARRGNEQSHREAVTALLGMFLLAVATSLLRPPLPIPRAVGIFGLLASLADQRGIDNEHEAALARFPRQQFRPRDVRQMEAAEAGTLEHPAHLSPMPRVGSHGTRGLQTRHASGMQQEGDHNSHHHPQAGVLQPHAREKPLESRQQIGDHDHGETPCSTGENPMIWPL